MEQTRPAKTVKALPKRVGGARSSGSERNASKCSRARRADMVWLLREIEDCGQAILAGDGTFARVMCGDGEDRASAPREEGDLLRKKNPIVGLCDNAASLLCELMGGNKTNEVKPPNVHENEQNYTHRTKIVHEDEQKNFSSVYKQ